MAKTAASQSRREPLLALWPKLAKTAASQYRREQPLGIVAKTVASQHRREQPLARTALALWREPQLANTAENSRWHYGQNCREPQLAKAAENSHWQEPLLALWPAVLS